MNYNVLMCNKWKNGKGKQQLIVTEISNTTKSDYHQRKPGHKLHIQE